MRKATNLLLILAFLFVGNAFGQSTDYSFVVPRSDDPHAPFPANQSGVRTVAGPYDLDGDGFVSSREYFVAKIFDKEKKGHLTSQERKEAEDALRNGFE